MDVRIVEQWNEFLNYFNDEKKDIYFKEEYVKLYENDESMAKCVVCKEGEHIILMPFFRKALGNYYDFETPYGYGGPISNTDDLMWVYSAINEMKGFMKSERYLCGFIRFHPLINNAQYCDKVFNVSFDRKTIAIDTSKSEDEIWENQITSKNRNMIRKAEKNGLIYETDYNFNHLEEFMKLYNATMTRLNADEFYFFDKQYFQKFVEDLRGKSFLGIVRKNERPICAALFMYTGKYGHYHLEGSDHTFSGLGANNYLLWKTAIEFHHLGVSEFHLGGGYDSSPDNSLLKFKKSFSGNSKNFYIGKLIFNQEKYDELKDDWKRRNPDKIKEYGNRLLCYRY